MIVAGNANITKVAAERIAKAALDHATEQGYCDEVERALGALGFPVPETNTTVVLTVTVNGRVSADDLTNAYAWNISHDYADDLDFDSAVVKK